LNLNLNCWVVGEFNWVGEFELGELGGGWWVNLVGNLGRLVVGGELNCW
jgi:hypothetical protein